MFAMFEAFAVVQIVICILLVVIILLQEGKKGMGAIFGGSSSSVFGARGAGNILTKITSVLAILFMLNSVWMSYISSSDKSVVKIEQQAEKTTPAPVAAQPAEEKKPEAAEQKNEQKEAPVEEQKPAEEQKEAPAE
jgi:preprotein translocase subunit SecG